MAIVAPARPDLLSGVGQPGRHYAIGCAPLVTMTRFLLAIAFIASTACGWTPPQGGAPTLPDGAHTIALKQLSLLGPNDIGPAIAASTSLSQVREAVTAHFGKARPGTPIPWSEVTDQPGQVYVAVLTNPECTRPVKEATALGD